MTKERIKRAALHLFGQQGYDKGSLAEIAREVGIKTPSIFSHFKNKEDLYLSVSNGLPWRMPCGRIPGAVPTVTGVSMNWGHWKWASWPIW